MSTQGYVRVETPVRMIGLEIDGRPVKVREGATILDACKVAAIETPTLCFATNLTPVNACRVCVVEVEGARVLAPACARKAEAGMKVKTDTDRVRLSRKLVLEFLASSVDMSTASQTTHDWIAKYEADPGRFGAGASSPGAPATVDAEYPNRDFAEPGHHAAPNVAQAAGVAQPPKLDNDLYMRDYSKCILCYKCVEACGDDAQNTFAIAVAGRDS